MPTASPNIFYLMQTLRLRDMTQESEKGQGRRKLDMEEDVSGIGDFQVSCDEAVNAKIQLEDLKHRFGLPNTCSRG